VSIAITTAKSAASARAGSARNYSKKATARSFAPKSGLFLIGLLFTVMSLINPGKSTTLGLPSKNTVFKTNGIYKISRNPMYIGFNCLTLASMLYTLNITVILLGVYSMMIYHLIILGEEKFLEQRFGDNYMEYKKTIRRYI